MYVTVTGRLADDPILKYTDRTEIPYCTFTLIQRHRWREPNGQWHVDQKTDDVYVWRRYGHHCADSLHKSDRVIVTGNRKTVTVKDDDNRLTTKNVIDAKDVALTLADGPIHLDKPARMSTAGNYGGTDPWASTS